MDTVKLPLGFEPPLCLSHHQSGFKSMVFNEIHIVQIDFKL